MKLIPNSLGTGYVQQEQKGIRNVCKENSKVNLSFTIIVKIVQL